MAFTDRFIRVCIRVKYQRDQSKRDAFQNMEQGILISLLVQYVGVLS
jgi:hypothetical protein